MKFLELGHTIIELDTVDSTNNYAKEMSKTMKNTDGVVVFSEEQTTGRGIYNNTWFSEAGKNLTFTIIHIPDNLSAEKQFYLSKATSLGICDFLETHVQPVFIKWPNDIYIKDKKIAGILIENTLSGDRIKHSFIGIGLNINQISFPNNIPNPTSLQKITKKQYDIPKMLRYLLCSIEIRLTELYTEAYEYLDEQYRDKLYLLKSRHRFHVGKDRIEGMIIDVETNGRLIIKDATGNNYTFGYKEVEYN
jgi:BirA family biotin operon repressor/biotin-[acetyl-CoA-carboxylase] ligase